MTQPTQARHPGRAVYRTIVAVGVPALALLPLLPLIADTLHLTDVGWVVAVLGAAAGITRVLALPGVEAWMHKHLPDLAAQPRPPESSPTPVVSTTLPAPGSIVWTTPGDTYGDTINAPTS